MTNKEEKITPETPEAPEKKAEDLNIRAIINAEVVLEVGGRIFKNTHCTNVSIGGMFVTIEGDLPAIDQGGTISLQYSCKDAPLSFVATCKVIWQRPKPEEDHLRGVGIRFTGMDRKSLTALRKLIEYQLDTDGPQQGTPQE